jgi:hypothetical protein
MNKPSCILRAVLLIILLLYLSGCEKLTDNYRKKYVGIWDFKYYYSEEKVTIGTTISDSVFYTGKISPGGDKDEIVIQYTAQNNITLHVDKNGLITDYCFQPSYCHGEFTDEKSFNYFWSARVDAGGVRTIYSKKIFGEKKD